VLRWAPGVTSARFAGEGADDAANSAKLLSKLEGYSLPRRAPDFAAWPPPSSSHPLRRPEGQKPAGGRRGRLAAGRRHNDCRLSAVAQRVCRHGANGGAPSPRSSRDGGFGYDPVFLPIGSELTVAQLPQEVKDQASHGHWPARLSWSSCLTNGLWTDRSQEEAACARRRMAPTPSRPRRAPPPSPLSPTHSWWSSS